VVRLVDIIYIHGMPKIAINKLTVLFISFLLVPVFGAQNQYHSDHRSGVLKIQFVQEGSHSSLKQGQDLAWDYLNSHRTEFGLSQLMDQLELVSVKESLLGKHYYYQQSLQDIPVRRGEVIVSVSKESGQVYKVFNNVYPVDRSSQKWAVPAQVDEESAYDIAWQDLRVHGEILVEPNLELVYVADGSELKLVYLVQFGIEAPYGYWEHEIDAVDGSIRDVRSTMITRKPIDWDFSSYKGPVLDRQDALKHFETKQKKVSLKKVEGKMAGGSAVVFDPDPVTTLMNDTITDTSPDSAFTNAYFTRTLQDITDVSGTFSLTGPWVTIDDWDPPTNAPSTTTDGNWTQTRGNNAFNDGMTYYHIDMSQRYMQSLGFANGTGIQYRSIPVDTDGANGADNSYFQYPSNRLAFGHGCVDDNEDMFVILHEYGHAINYSINNNWGGGDMGGIGEGWGDYWASSYRYSTPNGATFHPAWAYPWDGHVGCWPGRNLDLTSLQYNPSHTYGAHDYPGGVSSDELWGTPLFQSMVELINQGVPRGEIDRVLLESQFGLGFGLTMRQMAAAIVNTAKTLYPNGPHADVFQAKFEAQNILEAGSSTAAKTLLFAWVSNNSQYESIVVVNNTGSTTAQLTLAAQRSTGSPSTVTRSVPAGGFLKEKASSLFPAFGEGAGFSVKVESSSADVFGRWVTNNLEAESGKSPSQGVAVEVPSSPSEVNERIGQKLLYGYLPITDGLTSAPVVVNIGSVNTNVTLNFYDASGSLIASQVLENLEPFKPFATVVNNLVPAGSSDVHMIAESSGELISGVGFVFNTFSEPAIGNVSSLDSSISKTLVYSWVSNNSQYESIVVVNNYGASPVDVSLTAQRSTGPSAQATRSIAANGFLREKAATLFPSLGDGAGFTVQVTSTGDSVRGRWVTNNLEAASGKSPSQGVAVDVPLSGTPAAGNQRIGTKILLGYLPITDNLTSAPVIVNVGAGPTDVVLRFYDTAGNLVKEDATTLVNMEPFRPFATVANNLVSSGLGDVYMTAESSGELITGVGFVFNNFSEPAIGNGTVLAVNQSPSGSNLLNGVPVEGLSGASGERLTYSYEVPGDAFILSFYTYGGTGDADLLVKKGSPPTSDSDVDWFSDAFENREFVTLYQPGADTYYPSVLGYDNFSGVTLIASHFLVENTQQSQDPIELATSASMQFSVVVPEGTSNAIFTLNGPAAGDADLYVKHGSQPPSSASDSDGFSEFLGNNETILLHNPVPGEYQVIVYAYEAFQNVTLYFSVQ